MDISSIVAWIQMGLWIVAIVGFGTAYIRKVQRGDAHMLSVLASPRMLWTILGVGLLLSLGTLYLNYRPRTVTSEDKFHYSEGKLEEVKGRQFVNERVPLDGKHYSFCKFINVTFVYNGTASFGVDNTDIYGPPNVSTENPAVFAAWEMAKGFGFLKADTPLLTGPNFAPINVQEPHHVPQP